MRAADGSVKIGRFNPWREARPMEEVYDALVALKASIDKQNEQQESLIASVQALTEMIGHSIDATKELTEQLEENPEA
jgi:hypothetical protein